MAERRIIGLDLGIASEHTVRVLDGDGQGGGQTQGRPDGRELERRWNRPPWRAPAGDGARGGDGADRSGVAAHRRLLHPRGHRVFRVPSAKAHDMRRFFSRHAKSNGIDADALARLAIVDPEGLRPLELDDADAAALDRRVRACDRLTQEASSAQGPDQGPGPPAAAHDPAHRGPRAGRPGGPRALWPTPVTWSGWVGPGSPSSSSGPRHDHQGAGAGRRVAGCRPRRPRALWRPPRRRFRATWRPRWPPRCGCSGPFRPSWPPTRRRERRRYRTVDPGRAGPQPARD